MYAYHIDLLDKGLRCQLGGGYASAIEYYNQCNPQIFKMLIKSADMGNVESQHRVGMIYSTDSKLAIPSLIKAMHYLQLAASSGHVHAHKQLALVYAIGGQWDKSVTIFKIYAVQGDLHSMYRIGLCYHRGFGVEKNYIKAEQYLIKCIYLEQPYKSVIYNTLSNIYTDRPIEEQIMFQLTCTPFSELASNWLIEHAIEVNEYIIELKHTLITNEILIKPIYYIIMSYMWIIET